jgi:hypothetical protein
MDGSCEIRPTFKGETCPCTTCLVKSICVNTCKDWELYYKKIIYNEYTIQKQYDPTPSLDGHIHNKYERQRMMRLINDVVTSNPCAEWK